MLRNQEEIDIMASAAQPGLRDPKRSVKVFEQIAEDFFGGLSLDGQLVFDIGPGHHDLATALEGRGARFYFVDNDETVVKLGALRGHEGKLEDLKAFDPQAHPRFDGMFCRGSINGLWYGTRHADHEDFLRRLLGALSPDGWAWITPWNGPANPKLSDEAVEAALATQARVFREHGFWVHELSREQAAYWGAMGPRNRVLFGRNVPEPSRVFRRPAAPASPWPRLV